MAREPLPLDTADEPRLALADWGGTGTPLLLLHGMGGNFHWWASTAPRLAAGAHPVGLDFRGHGRSAWQQDGRYETDGFLADIDAALRRLDWARPVLVAHSLGARIAIEYAARRPERVLGLVAVDFLPEFEATEDRRFERPRRLRQPVYSDREAMVRRFRLEPAATALDGPSLNALARLCIKEAANGYTWRFDWRSFLYRYESVWPALARLTAPLLAVRGEHSTILTRAGYERVLEIVPGARGVEIPGAHHHVPLDRPEAMADAALAWLKLIRSPVAEGAP